MMKKILIQPIYALSLLALTSNSQAAVTAGDVIGLDFGGPTNGAKPSVNPTNDFNLINSTGASGTLKNLSGVALAGVTLTTTGTGLFFNGDPNDSVAGLSTDYNISNVTDWTGSYSATLANSWTFAFNGLDDSLTYNLEGVIGGFVGTGIADGSVISSGSSTTLSPATESANPRVGTLTGLTSSGGSLTVTVSNAGGKAAVLSAATLTVVPEPSSTALLGLGGLALILRRRK